MQYDLNELRAYFGRDHYAELTGIEIDSAADDAVVCSMKIVPERHHNGANNVQGGALFTLCDLTFAVHSNLAIARGDDVGVTVAQSVSISYLKASRGSVLYAKSEQMHRGRNVSVFRVTITDDLGVTIATALCNGAQTSVKPPR
ncbi:MAG: PaaI family thioesterase [Oscillospiraceae bacterium]|jgi:acyl-CoA thioesterase|nr:PaaI family thioesterase [Oscillospiraceae bacterium]